MFLHSHDCLEARDSVAPTASGVIVGVRACGLTPSAVPLLGLRPSGPKTIRQNQTHKLVTHNFTHNYTHALVETQNWTHIIIHIFRHKFYTKINIYN
jgi:hypothetical protein